MQQSGQDRQLVSTHIALWVSVVALLLLVLKAAVQSRNPNLKFDDMATIGLLVFATVPWLARVIEGLKFGDVEIKFRKLEEDQQQQAAQLDRQNRELREHAQYLTNLFEGMIGESGRAVLASLRDNKPYIYKFSDQTKQEYRTMLRQLRLFGFIIPRRSIHDLIDSDLPEVDLTRELSLTKPGREYLDSQSLNKPA